MKMNYTDLSELPAMEWPSFLILIMLILAFVATLLYVRARTRIGFNDSTPEQESDEDNTIIEALIRYNEKEIK